MLRKLVFYNTCYLHAHYHSFCMSKGTVRKQTRQGWDHTILLRFVRTYNTDSLFPLDNFHFEWTPLGNKRVRKIPLNLVKEVQCWKRVNG